MNEDMAILYQGGTPVNDTTDNIKYKPLQLSIAKINFKSEMKPKFNQEYFSSNFTSVSKFINYKTPSSM